ncbi:MAG: hypothetical protein JSV39_02495 [Candidatus Aenigmatarchaeota archaeon]|nr:MAG: hypothetical protein JSV39_02495 [Candidatus Aenigmarchaeota archaeon]
MGLKEEWWEHIKRLGKRELKARFLALAVLGILISVLSIYAFQETAEYPEFQFSWLIFLFVGVMMTLLGILLFYFVHKLGYKLHFI